MKRPTFLKEGEKSLTSIVGNVLMLSEGRPAIDRVFSLQEGILRIEVDKPTYERLGLQGFVMASEGRKHIKARYGEPVNPFS